MLGFIRKVLNRIYARFVSNNIQEDDNSSSSSDDDTVEIDFPRMMSTDALPGFEGGGGDYVSLSGMIQDRSNF